MLEDVGEAYETQLLAVQGFVFGTANIVIVGLPRGWRTTPGWTKPDVTRWQVFGSKSWATEALGTYWILVPPDVGEQGRGAPRRERGLRGSSAAGWASLPAMVRTGRSGEADAAGHAVPWQLGEIQRRLWLRQTQIPALTVGWQCQRTQRSLELLFTGGTPTHLAALVPALGALRCH